MIVAGVSGLTRNACVALADGQTVRAVCEEERIVRARAVGMTSVGFPAEALQACLASGGFLDRTVTAFVTAEKDACDRIPSRCTLVDHHEAHAALALAYASEGDAIACVCDGTADTAVSFWRRAEDGRPRLIERWSGDGFATLLQRAAAVLGFGAGELHKFEALARTGTARSFERLINVARMDHGRFAIDHALEAAVAALRADVSSRGQAQDADAASTVQGFVAHLLAGAIRQVVGAHAKCVALSGGLFHNTAINSAVAAQDVAEQVMVPVDPGNAGLAAGALIAAGHAAPRGPSPFLGPDSDSQDIKATLDNCKLSYTYLRDDEIVAETVGALRAGQLVAWFQGRMEWGRRALGNRSILANPRAPYVLENLNRYLKHRESYVSYGLIACEEDVHRYFVGPDSSPYMQFDFEVRDCQSLRWFLPVHGHRVRVQTVPQGAGWMRRLLKAFGDPDGVSLLVNTSFNGFREPIVCTPRDAVRVFYGTGLDMLVIGNFVLRK